MTQLMIEEEKQLSPFDRYNKYRMTMDSLELLSNCKETQILLTDKSLTNVRAVKLFYVTNGRNAWNSIWVKQYTSNCMYRTLDGAKNYCEKSRTNGSVFYIQELPALEFISEDKSLFVTQINTDTPLADWKNVVADLFIVCTEEKNKSISSSLRDIYLGFQSSREENWKKRQPITNSVLIFYSNNLFKIEMQDDFSKIRKKESCVYRSDSSLSWIDVENKIIPDYIVSIEKLFLAKLSETNFNFTKIEKANSSECRNPHSGIKEEIFAMKYTLPTEQEVITHMGRAKASAKYTITFKPTEKTAVVMGLTHGPFKFNGIEYGRAKRKYSLQLVEIQNNKPKVISDESCRDIADAIDKFLLQIDFCIVMYGRVQKITCEWDT